MVQYPKLTFIFVDGKQKKSEAYHLTERNKLNNQIQVVKTFVQKIKTTVGLPAVVAIEGLSFGSPGNSLIDLAHATGILKLHLLNSGSTTLEQNFIFSPSELKNAGGSKGNANKIDVFNAFLENPKIEKLRESDLFKFIVANKIEIFNGKVVKSPIMDMIDATLGVIKLQSFLS